MPRIEDLGKGGKKKKSFKAAQLKVNGAAK